MKSIVLIGYMCVGKTTIGKSLAKKLGRTFYDLDWYIEERYRKKVSEIFATEGEEKFRELEYRMLHEVAEFEDIVLSCGGGTPCSRDNMEYLNDCSHTVYLKANVETILQHLKDSRQERPLLKGKTLEELKQFITKQLQEREPFYKKAKHTINIDILDDLRKIDAVAEQIMNIFSI